MLANHGHSVHPRGLKIGMDEFQEGESVLHYSDFRISGFEFFGFFRIFILYSHIIDPRLLNFGMLGSQNSISDFHYSDIGFCNFGFSGFSGFFWIFPNFHFRAVILVLGF